MTDNEMRIAIAEACGWTSTHVGGVSPLGIPPKVKGKTQAAMFEDVIPDYPNDLNATHEAEKTLRGDQIEIYVECLITDDVYCSKLWDCAHATARQRAEAFLRTIGKWRE